MAGGDKDDVPMLSDTNPSLYDEQMNSQFQSFDSASRSSSVSVPINVISTYDCEANLAGYTGPQRSERGAPFPQIKGKEPTPKNLRSWEGKGRAGWSNRSHDGKNQHLLRSGRLGLCSDPYCTTCPTNNLKTAQRRSLRASGLLERKFHNALYKGCARKCWSFMSPYIPGVMNPHTKIIQKWNQFFVIACLVAIFLDPLFFFLLSVNQDNKCIVIDWPMTKTLVVFRSMTDIIYLLHILLQFRLAYVAPETRVVGAGELEDHPKKIALNYLKSYFFVDLFVALPLPQIIVLFVLPRSLGSSGANYAKNLLRAAVLVQYIPRLFRFLPLLVGQSPNGFIFETAWANFVLNLFTFMLSGHVIGSFWYLFGLQRVNQCLRTACRNSEIQSCPTFIDCGHGDDVVNRFDLYPTWDLWKSNGNATSCFTSNGYPYGIYIQAISLVAESSTIRRYVYSLFWGFQQISTLAGNQVPSFFVWEVLFTMAIIGLGLLLFALLIGNMQNFLQALGQRRLQMSLRRRDVEQWMVHRRLPVELRRQVREAERYSWAATRGVNEEMLMVNLPEDLQRDIRRHLFKFLKKVRIFSLMEEPILDSIREKLRQRTYIHGSEVFFKGGLVEKMVFIVRGKMESLGADGIVMPLSEGDVCGEELLAWCLEHSSVNRDGRRTGIVGPRLVSTRAVRCLTNVEAFSLHVADLEQVTSLFARFLRNHRVQGAIRYESPYWRSMATNRIQVAWRYWKKCRTRAGSG